MTPQAITGVEHLTQVFEDHGITEHVWFYWRCSCGAGRRGLYDGIYSHRSVAEARAGQHLEEVSAP